MTELILTRFSGMTRPVTNGSNLGRWKLQDIFFLSQQLIYLTSVQSPWVGNIYILFLGLSVIEDRLPRPKIFISGILIVGGYDRTTSSRLKSAEVFNPSTGITCSVGDMPVVRERASLCNRMVCGGYPKSGYMSSITLISFIQSKLTFYNFIVWKYWVLTTPKCPSCESLGLLCLKVHLLPFNLQCIDLKWWLMLLQWLYWDVVMTSRIIWTKNLY